MRAAIIKDGKVENIIEISESEMKNLAGAVAVLDKMVTIGDDYVEGKFLRNGQEVLSMLELNNKELATTIKQLNDDLKTVKNAIIELYESSLSV